MARSQRGGIECVADGKHVLLPADCVGQIVEYEVTPLPLSRPCVAGVGVVGEQLIVSVQLHPAAGEAPGNERRTVTGALLVAAGEDQLRLAVEVTRVIQLVNVLSNHDCAGDGSGWLGEATTEDGRTLPWLDVPRMLADLGASTRNPLGV